MRDTASAVGAGEQFPVYRRQLFEEVQPFHGRLLQRVFALLATPLPIGGAMTYKLYEILVTANRQPYLELGFPHLCHGNPERHAR